MYRCEFWCNDEELWTARLAALPPIGYTVRMATRYAVLYVVDGGEIFFDDDGDGDVVATVYLREAPEE